MQYTVLARKYRPQTFEQIYAQDHVTKILISSVEKDRIAGAYLFTGPRGVGKTSLARIFAKSLNCLEGPTVHPCGKCSNCTEIEKVSLAAVYSKSGDKFSSLRIAVGSLNEYARRLPQVEKVLLSKAFSATSFGIS